MATIKHSLFYADVSVQNAIRYFVQFLTTTQPKTGFMWEVVFSIDSAPLAEFGPLPLVFILKRTVNTAGTVFMYAKIVVLADGIHIIVSPEYNATTDNNATDKLKGSWKSGLEADNSLVDIFDHASGLTTPAVVKTPAIKFDSAFDPMTQKLSKVWLIRKLGPRMDEVTPRKLTDLYGWMTFCTEETGANPIDTRGYFQHIGFGMAGDILVPDVDLKNGAGMFAAAGSFSGADNVNATGMRVYAGGPSNPEDALSNIGSIFLAGRKGPWEGTTKPVWFYPNTQYGYCRSPFDSELFIKQPKTNVGFDFTELCKYSPYSGVRTLTPAYLYGRYDNLDRILGRVPVIYTSLEGLYAGDMISQDKDGIIKNFMIFPFHKYDCSPNAEAKLGYAIHVPSDEDV